MSLTILRASAGSGKTYALTFNYLQLLLKQEHPAYFRSILAVTFTNKATKEMKERILSELEKLAAGETEGGMGTSLLEVLGIEAASLQKRAKAALVDILHNYSHFSVSTITPLAAHILSYLDTLVLFDLIPLVTKAGASRFVLHTYLQTAVGSHQPPFHSLS